MCTSISHSHLRACLRACTPLLVGLCGECVMHPGACLRTHAHVKNPCISMYDRGCGRQQRPYCIAVRVLLPLCVCTFCCGQIAAGNKKYFACVLSEVLCVCAAGKKCNKKYFACVLPAKSATKSTLRLCCRNFAFVLFIVEQSG